MCTICEHYGKNVNATETDSIYDESKVVKILLCRPHSVELFRKGQVKFLLNHVKILSTIAESNHPKFIDVLESNYKKHRYLI